MEESSVMMVGLNENRIMQGIDVIKNSKSNLKIPKDYDVNNVSEKVTRIILSYIDYINLNVYKNLNNLIIFKI